MPIYAWMSLAILLSFSSVARSESQFENQYSQNMAFDQISSGKAHTCGIRNGLVYCWGNDAKGQSSGLNGMAADSVKAKESTTCILKDGVITCRGEDWFEDAPTSRVSAFDFWYHNACVLIETQPGQRQVSCFGWGDDLRDMPSLVNPTAIAVGETFACAIDENALKCWGPRLPDIQSVTNPTELISSSDNFCVRADEGVRCFGQTLEAPEPREGHEVRLIAGASGLGASTCFSYDDDKIDCSGNLKPSRPLDLQFRGIKSISVGRAFLCVADGDGIHCFAVVNVSAEAIPPLREIRDLSAASSEFCALSESKFFCFGNDSHTVTPPLTNAEHITKLIHGIYTTCGVEGDSLSCFAFNSRPGYHEFPGIPILSGIKDIDAGTYSICAIDSSGLKCWGLRLRDVPRPVLYNPNQVAVGAGFFCVNDDRGLSCYGENDYGQTNNPYFYHLKDMSLGEDFGCGQDDEGIRCWGKHFSGDLMIPGSKNPTSLATGYDRFCAVTDDGVKCYRSSSSHDFDHSWDSFAGRKAYLVRLSAEATCVLYDDGLYCRGDRNTFTPVLSANKI